jgi:hypothetical protein
MTRKAHNVDKQRTEEAYFLDKRSYWTHKGHQYVFGQDAAIVRAVVANLSHFKCNVCFKYVGGDEGHLDHIRGGNTDDRCWCGHNLQWLCRACHRAKHASVRWTKRETMQV